MESTNEKIQISTKEIGEMIEDRFNPKAYLDTYYSEEENSVEIENRILAAMIEIREHLSRNNGSIDMQDIIKYANLEPAEAKEHVEDIIVFEFQRRIAQVLLKEYPKDKIKVLDVGGGPTIYQHMVICLAAGSITHSDFLKKTSKK